VTPALQSPLLQSPLLQVEHLSIYFRDQAVVNDLTFSIHCGEVLGLVGESGSGKSLTALSILRLLDPAARVDGTIRLDGRDLLALKPDQMRHYRGSKIAMVFQEPMTALNPVMPVGRQIAEALEIHQRQLTRKQVRDAVVEAMTEVAIPDPEQRLRDYPHQFSGGQRQRLLIAMALINRPSLLIADEPTTALDVTVQAQVLLLLRRLQQRNGLGMLFISHDLAVVAQVADRVAVMRGGILLETGTRDQVFHHPGHAYTRSLLGAVPTLATDRDELLATLAGSHTGMGAVSGILREQSPGHWVRGISEE
jgi:peptide/nickel transport system ATP-binding protein